MTTQTKKHIEEMNMTYRSGRSSSRSMASVQRHSPAALMAAAASLAVTALFAAMAPAAAHGQTPEEKGRSIAEEVDRRDLGWGDESSQLEMVLTNRNGSTSTRVVRRQVLETHEAGVGDQSVVIFDSPRDVSGTALLSHTKILEPDDQWLYLPALGRVKRISSANKSGPFVGSEFAFEDLVSQEVDKYEYRWLRDETCAGVECHVVERIPLYENSGYVRQVVWWDTAEFRFQRVDYYDRKDALLKTLTYDGYQQYEGQFWRPDSMTMENHQTGKATVLNFSDYVFQAGLDDSAFTPARLRRTR